MKNIRIEVPNDGVPVLVDISDAGSYGKTLGFYNSSAEDLELCGSEDSVDESWRGFLAGSVIFLDVDPKEPMFVVNNGAADVEIDVMAVQ